MIWTFFKRWRARHMQRQSMDWMLRRGDDKWLNDIGLTRNDLRNLVDEAGDQAVLEQGKGRTTQRLRRPQKVAP